MKRVITLAGLGITMSAAIVGVRMLGPTSPQSTPATETTVTHEQPRTVPSQINEKEDVPHAAETATASIVDVRRIPQPEQAGAGASLSGGAHARSGAPPALLPPSRESTPPPRTAASGGIADVPGDRTSGVVSERLVTADPYRNTMFPEGSKWTTFLATATVKTPNVFALAASTADTTPAKTAATDDIPTGSIVATSNQQLPSCLTIAPDFQSQCATANRWLDDIGAKYGAGMQRHYRWLSAALVDDWLKNGAGVQPADYFGTQGYDSPLGTCHSTTPFKRFAGGTCSAKDDALGCAGPRLQSTKGTLRGTPGDDGKVRGWVRYHGGWYVGTVDDAACTDSCVAGFDHPCDIETERESPFIAFDVAGAPFSTWWWGGDPGREP